MKYVYLMLLLTFSLMVGCRNYSTVTETYGGEGNLATRSTIEYKSKFTEKNVAVLTEVEAFKVTTSPDASGSILPQISFGWFWTALITMNVETNGELLFLKCNSHWFVDNTSGVTMLYIRNNTKVTQQVELKSKPKLLIDLPFVRFGAGPNLTEVHITPMDGESESPTTQATVSGGNEIIIKPPKKSNSVVDNVK